MDEEEDMNELLVDEAMQKRFVDVMETFWNKTSKYYLNAYKVLSLSGHTIFQWDLNSF